jgi:hypothetical protein
MILPLHRISFAWSNHRKWKEHGIYLQHTQMIPADSLTWKFEGKGPLVRQTLIIINNIKMDLKRRGYEVLDRIQPASNSINLRAVVNIALNRRAPKMAGNLSKWATYVLLNRLELAKLDQRTFCGTVFCIRHCDTPLFTSSLSSHVHPLLWHPSFLIPLHKCTHIHMLCLSTSLEEAPRVKVTINLIS